MSVKARLQNAIQSGALRSSLNALGALSLILGATSASASINYTFTTITAPGSLSTQIRSINASGDVAGSYLSASTGLQTGFVESGGNFVHYIEGPYELAQDSYLVSINNSGVAVGYHTYRGQYTGGILLNKYGNNYGYHDIGSSQYVGVNNNGLIAANGPIKIGNVSYAFAAQVASVSGSKPVNITDLLFAVADAINDNGVVAGHDDEDAFVKFPGSATQRIVVPGSNHVIVTGINNLDEVAGFFGGGHNGLGGLSGFVESGGGITVLNPEGSLYTLVTSINANGDVAGFYTDATQSQNIGFVESGGKYTLISPLGVQNTVITSINDKGVIAGYYNNGAADIGFIGTPTASVPEPAAWAMMLVGFGALGASLRRCRAKEDVAL